jgi:peptidoglycan/LPS O-acetylase OafA/YrhL
VKLKFIDSIRGVAILMVIFGHIGQEIKGLSFIPHLLTSYGQMGVQLFFVASAYTLCLSATNRLSESHSLKKYAIRRFFRIAPVYYLGLLGYFFLALFLTWNKSGIVSIPSKYNYINILTNVFFVHGFYMPANNNIVPGGWSIGTEMAFYVLFPFLFYFGTKITDSSVKKGLVFLSSVFIFSQLLLCLISFLTGFYVESNNFLYYNLVNQLPVFCVGITYYLIENNLKFKTDWKFDFMIFIVLSLFSLLLWNSNWQNIFSIIPFISAISFVFLMNVLKKKEVLNFNFLTKIGAVSYSMYIIHFALLNFSGSISMRLSEFVNKNIMLFVLFLITVTITFLVAVISEKYVEKPFIANGRKIIAKIKK